MQKLSTPKSANPSTTKSRSDLARRAVEEVGDVAGLLGLFYTAAEVERRLPRAYDLRAKGCWPKYADDPDLAFGYNDAVLTPGPATSREVTNYDLALQISQWLDEDDRKLVWAASHSAARSARGPRWRAISKILRCHPATAKRRTERAILGLWHKMLCLC